jgi:hypothetical protein
MLAKCHECVVRSHAEIIRSVGGPVAFHDQLGLIGKVFAVRSWTNRNHIPSWCWKRIAERGFASLDELAAWDDAFRTPAQAA